MNGATYRAYRFFWRGLDLLFPPVCGGCGQPGARWCARCDAKAKRLAPPWCPSCGMPSPGGEICSRCREHPPALQAFRSWAFFDGPVRNALHRIKYRRDIALADALTLQMLKTYRAHLAWQVDAVLPVPLSRQRLQERGYNQAALFALPLALALGTSYRPAALRRVRHTRSQVELSWEQRQENVAGAFIAAPDDVSGKTILLVDDVITTGATLNACASALRSAGARTVYAFSVARTPLRSAAP